MKISYRILFINFAVVVAILTSSAVAIYSVIFNAVSSQQTRYLVNSANNFMFTYRGLLQDSEDEFLFLADKNFRKLIPGELKDLDFILRSGPDSLAPVNVIYSAGDCYLTDSTFTIFDFIENNPLAVVRSAKTGKYNYYYGRIFNEEVLNILSQRIGLDIAIIFNHSVVEVSNSAGNKNNFSLINQANIALLKKDFPVTFAGSSDTEDIIAVRYVLNTESELSRTLNFILFTKLDAASDFKSSLLKITLLIGLTGVILSLILTMLFTDKMRKQIIGLSNATEVLRKGNFNQKIDIKSNDELGRLGTAFNTMLDELATTEQSKNEYSEFITLINRNPSLGEISETALSKIIKTCGYIVGALYIVEDGNFKKTASYGLFKDFIMNQDPGLFKTVVSKREPIEIHIDDNYPKLASGFVNFNLKEVLILPIINNNRVIAIIELGAVSKPSERAKDFISRIQEQLAVGLTNALAFVQLENLVSELQKLNEEYQNQNQQVRLQNETLIKLHQELKEKADELAVQKHRAEESTRLKSQFLASMSHELRTPMNSILGLTELILEESLITGKNQERLEVVLKNGRRLMNLINDILDLSKIEAGKMELRQESLLLEEILDEIETCVIPLLQDKQINFEIERHIDTEITIVSDHGKLMQILLNLLGNAVKFTEKGSVKLSVSSPSDKILQFDVEDTGIGITDQDQRIIFEEFRQADGTTTRKYGGTGLGLAITNRLTALLKGSISFASREGKGSIFTVKIPLVKGETPHSGSDFTLKLDSLKKNKAHPILVIDNDEKIRVTIREYLNSRGYQVVFAENGSEGLDKAIKLQPFAITLDLMLPDNDGWTTLRNLKENPLTQNIPVILISILGDRQAGYGLGAFEYFIKPVNPAELLSTFIKLENLVDKQVEKVVIVDDDELEFEKFKKEFSSESLRIDYIRDSEFAFSKILEIQPDLVIIDLLMPAVDGITLSYKLKSHKETRHIPIIISTAKDLSEQEKASLQNIVEKITVKAKGHPMDVLKIVRDRIKMQEKYTLAVQKKEASGSITDTDDGLSRSGTLNVMIVDDDPDALYTLNEIVQSSKCTTILASSGQECLRLLEKNIPDLVLLDIMMPEMDGFQTLSNIRANKKLGNIPVYAVTAKAMVEDKAIIMKHGFDDYLFKPVNAGVLAFKLKKLLYILKVDQ